MPENTDCRSAEDIRVDFHSFTRLTRLVMLALEPLHSLGEPHFAELAKEDFIHLPVTNPEIVELLDNAEDPSSDLSDFFICMQEVGSLFGFGVDINPNIQYDEKESGSNEAKYILSVHSHDDETFEELPTKFPVGDKTLSRDDIELVLDSSWQRPTANQN